MSVALLALLAFATAVPARSGDVTVLLTGADVEVRARSAWPTMLNKGWAPLRLELHNRSSEPARLRLDANADDWTNTRAFRQAFELAPGERVDTELLLPAGGQWERQWNVRLRSQRGDDLINSSVLAEGGELNYFAILAVSDVAVSPSTVAQWSEKTSKNVAKRGWVAPGTTPTPDDARIGHARYEDLARNAGAYTSLDLVVLDARSELPPEASLEPLAAWVRSGGVVLVAGSRGRELALARPSLAPWMEARFRAEHVAGDAQLFGMGLLAFHPADGWFDDADLRDTVYALAREECDMAPRADDTSRTVTKPIEIPGLGQIPHRVFVLLLMLFGVVIGPLNFLWIARKRRPVLLLITIPAIALVTTLALLTYGIYFQGLDVKTASQSMTVLDERLHRSACVERRLLYAGMSPGEGLRPEAGTSVHVHRPSALGAFTPLDRQFLRLEQDPALVLGGDYLPTRVPVFHVLQSERAARGRLEVRRVDGGLSVRNGLGARIEALSARDDRGQWFASSGPIDAGASATLTPTEPPSSNALLAEPAELLWKCGRRASEGSIPVASYLARLERSPFRDDCGIETTEIVGDHRVLGVWDLQSEAWR